MKKNIIGLLTLILLAGCSADKKEQQRFPVHVKAAKVALVTSNTSRNFVGVIEESDGVNANFSVMGTVTRIYVDEGDYVKAGQPLAELDGNLVRNQYEMAKATLNQAEDAYRRLKNLYDKGTLPEIKMVEMETNLQKARAAESVARKSLDNLTLRAPWSGYVAKRHVELGANATPGFSGFRLVKIDQVKLCVSVAERQIADITKGQRVTFTIAALGDREFEGKVVTKGVTANIINHAYSVRALVQNSDHVLLPGMVADVNIYSLGTERQLVVPQQAVLVSGKEKFVWTIRDGKASRCNVTTGGFTDQGIVITGGLKEGETVITEGQPKVCEGLEVESK